jgi:hypothetical protein
MDLNSPSAGRSLSPVTMHAAPPATAVPRTTKAFTSLEIGLGSSVGITKFIRERSRLAASYACSSATLNFPHQRVAKFIQNEFRGRQVVPRVTNEAMRTFVSRTILMRRDQIHPDQSASR